MRGPYGNLHMRRPRAAVLKRIAAIGSACLVVGAYLLSVTPVSALLIDQMQVIPPLTAPELTAATSGAASAIVILSAGRRTYAPEFGGATVDSLSLERVRYGALLARMTGLPVLVSGGIARAGEPSLAQIMAGALEQDYGLTARWQEVKSETTAENAIYSAGMLKEAGIIRVVLVTHAWHMKRAQAAFAANGMTVIPAPTAFYRPPRENMLRQLLPSMAAFRMSGYAIHEIVGSLWYAARYGY